MKVKVCSKDLVEAQSNLVINQEEQLLLQIAGLPQENHQQLSGCLHEDRISSILGLDLMRKYGLIVDLRSVLLRAPHGDLSVLAMETIAVQQVCSVVDPAQELVEPCKEIFSAEQIGKSKEDIAGLP